MENPFTYFYVLNIYVDNVLEIHIILTITSNFSKFKKPQRRWDEHTYLIFRLRGFQFVHISQ